MLNATLLIFTLLSPVEEIDNPEFKSWSQFGPGTSVTVKMVNETHKMEMVTTTTLKSKSAKELVLEAKTTMVVAGNKIEQPAQKRTVPAKMKKFEVKPEDKEKAPKPKTGKEKVKAGGKEYDCKWTETTIEMQGTKTVSKVWTCDDVPGGLVKMTSNSTGKSKMKMTQTLVNFEKK